MSLLKTRRFAPERVAESPGLRPGPGLGVCVERGNRAARSPPPPQRLLLLVPLWLLLRFVADVALFSVVGGCFPDESEEHI